MQLFAKEHYLFANPDFLLMGKPVIATAKRELIRSPLVAFAPERVDSWYIYFACGDFRACLASMPYYLPWVIWERQKPNKETFSIYKTEELWNRVLPQKTIKIRH